MAPPPPPPPLIGVAMLCLLCVVALPGAAAAAPPRGAAASSQCTDVLGRLCPRAAGSTAARCNDCVGSHQAVLRRAGCSALQVRGWCTGGSAPPAPAPARASAQVGMMYEGWHAPAYWGRRGSGGSIPSNTLTVEDIIRSNGSLSMANASAGFDNARRMGFWWHKQPADGFYCIYRKRASENASSCGLPDCPNITATLTRHAKMLTDVGVDFIVADSTNIQDTGAAADALQLRPWEVLGEEWLQLRKAGTPTPKIAIWQNLGEATGDLYKEYVKGAYSDPAYEDLIFKDVKSGKKVMFTTANPTAALVKDIEADGTIVVVTMWAERMNFDKGEWAFFSPCIDEYGPLKLGKRFTSSVYSDPQRPCSQELTTHSPIGQHGTSLTVGPSYQLSYSSLPFRASGKLGGLVLKKQFERAFEEHAKGTLDFLQVGTFNEHVAQPQPNRFHAWVKSMGLEGDAMASSLWVDMFGDGITRDLEPTVQDGGRMWALFESCMRVFRTGAATCANLTESCCVRGDGDPPSHWVNVWSLRSSARGAAAAAVAADHGGGGGDRLLTSEENERDALLRGGGWSEVCSPAGGATAFCSWNGDINAMSPDAESYTSGPFLMYATPVGALNSRPCYRCLSADEQRHSISGDKDCAGRGKAEMTLGHVATHRSSETPRSLRVCQNGTAFFHSLGAACVAPAKQLEFLGFVH